MSFGRIAKLFETGIFIKWKNDALPPDNDCTTVSKPQAGDTRKINIAQMIGSFYILMFGLCGALGALLIEYLFITSKNKGRLPDIKGIQCKLCSHFFPSMFASGKLEQGTKPMNSRIYPESKEYPKSRKKRKNKKLYHTKAMRGTDNKGNIYFNYYYIFK